MNNNNAPKPEIVEDRNQPQPPSSADQNTCTKDIDEKKFSSPSVAKVVGYVDRPAIAPVRDVSPLPAAFAEDVILKSKQNDINTPATRPEILAVDIDEPIAAE